MKMQAAGGSRQVFGGSRSQLPWPFWGFVVTVLVGLLLGGHQWEIFAGYDKIFSYGYWVLRLLTAYLLFVGCLLLLEVTPLGEKIAWGWLAGLAAVITLPFFTLCVTMLDLLLGLPELGLLGLGLDPDSTVTYSAELMAQAFAMESLYHVDNYLAFCTLVLVPRLVLELRRGEVAGAAADAKGDAAPVNAAASATAPVEPAGEPAFLQRFDPPLSGRVLAVQAQEHYVRVVTSGGATTTLYRFGDALRELEGLPGLQVHRSYWVADDGVASLKSGRRGLRIVLRNGEQVPVSAKHADLVQRRFGARLETVA
jgi:hypothetical protein